MAATREPRVAFAWLLPGLILVATLCALAVRTGSAFTIHPTVRLGPPAKGIQTDEVLAQDYGTERVNVRCSALTQPAEAHYVDDDGATLFFLVSPQPTYPDSQPLCATAREDRKQTIVLYALVGILAAGCVVVGQRGLRRRNDVTFWATPAT
jgi:hypothetical protein